MTRSATAAPTASLLVRFDSETRQTLVRLADASDRTVSQLVRAALRWWIDQGDQVCPLHSVGDATGGGLVNVRFGEALMTEIQTVAEDMSIERAGVIRCAVRAWVTVADAAALGTPGVPPRGNLTGQPIPRIAAAG